MSVVNNGIRIGEEGITAQSPAMAEITVFTKAQCRVEATHLKKLFSRRCEVVGGKEASEPIHRAETLVQMINEQLAGRGIWVLVEDIKRPSPANAQG